MTIPEVKKTIELFKSKQTDPNVVRALNELKTIFKSNQDVQRYLAADIRQRNMENFVREQGEA